MKWTIISSFFQAYCCSLKTLQNSHIRPAGKKKNSHSKWNVKNCSH